MESCNHTRSDAKVGIGFILGLLTGSLIGAATAILMAPQSGTETREILKRKASEARDKAGSAAEDLREDVGEWTTRTKGRMAEKMSEARGKLSEAVAQALQRAPENGRQAQVSPN